METIHANLLFPKFKIFIKTILTLPHLSANVERIFSPVNINKTKQRNRLDNITIGGTLYTKDYLKLNKKNKLF